MQRGECAQNEIEITEIDELIHAAFSPDACSDSGKVKARCTQPEQSPNLLHDAAYHRYMGKRYEALCAEYQQNIKRSERYRIAMIKGLKSGEALENLFIGAAKAISLMTGDEVFFHTVCREMEKRLA